MHPSARTRTEHGTETVVAVRPDGRGGTRTTLRSGLLAPRLLGTAPGGVVRVALVAVNATLLGGDTVTVRVEIDAGCEVELVDVAGTVAYDGRGETATWTLDVDLATGATLRWDAAPLVASAGARLRRRTDVHLADGATLLLRDTLVLGRTGEPPGTIDCRTRMTIGSRPAVAEDLSLSSATSSAPGVMGDARVVDTLTALGWRPRVVEDVPHLALAAPGAIARTLVRDAHTSRVGQAFRAWEAELVSAGEPAPDAEAGSPPRRAAPAPASGSW